ncbi:stress response small protein YobI [Escherichia coli]
MAALPFFTEYVILKYLLPK